MKRRGTILGLSTLGISAFIFASLLLHGNLAKSSQPKIDFEEEMWDFGTLAVGENVSHNFKFRNSGDAKLQINKIDSSCACAATLLSSTTLKPQETGELKIDFKQLTPKNVPRTVKIYSTDPSTPVKTLTIRANVVQPYEVKPPHLFFDAGGTKELEISSPAGLNLQLTNVETSTECLSAVIGAPENVHSNVRFRVRVKFLAPTSVQNLDEQITIHSNRDVDPIIIPVRIQMMSQKVGIHPKNLFFGAVSRSKKVFRSAFISVPAGDSGIERIENKSQAILTNLVKERDKKIVVVVELSPDAVLGRFRDTIKIHTNDPSTLPLELTVYGMVLP